MLTTTNTTTEAPHRLLCELTSYSGIITNTRDPDPNVLIKSKRALYDMSLGPDTMEYYMRKLFFHDFINDEIVETYNGLERRWKYMTSYRMTTATPVLWQEK